MQAARGGSSESVYRLDCLTNGGVKAKQQEKLKWEGHLALSIKQGVGLLWQQSWGAHWAAVFHNNTPAMCVHMWLVGFSICLRPPKPGFSEMISLSLRQVFSFFGSTTQFTPHASIVICWYAIIESLYPWMHYILVPCQLRIRDVFFMKLISIVQQRILIWTCLFLLVLL